MLIKPRAMSADPTKICRTCTYYDPDLHVCCANDYAIRDEEANTMSCGDWNPKKICITCDHFDPDTNQCWFEEHDMSEEESLTRTCESWEPRKVNIFTSAEHIIGMDPVNPVKVPLQPDGSLKMQASETIWDHRLEAKALDRGAKQGMTLEALDTVFAIACQQVPSLEKRWMELKGEINVMFAQKWAAEDMPS